MVGDMWDLGIYVIIGKEHSLHLVGNLMGLVLDWVRDNWGLVEDRWGAEWLIIYDVGVR